MIIYFLNCAFISFLLGFYDASKKTFVLSMKQRADLIAKYFSESDADVVIFSECFDKKVTKQFLKDLHSTFPFQWRDTRTPFLLLGVHSGLAIVSKYPIINPKIKTFRNLCGDSALSRKGFVHCKILDHEIIGSHFNASMGGMVWSTNPVKTLKSSTVVGWATKPFSVLRSQPKAMFWHQNDYKIDNIKQIKDFLIIDEDDIIVFLGDSNLDRRSDDPSINNAFGIFGDCYTINPTNDPTKWTMLDWSDAGLMAKKQALGIIDHALNLNPDNKKVKMSSTYIQAPFFDLPTKSMVLSDHLPVKLISLKE